MTTRLEFIALENFPLVEPGDNLNNQIIESLQHTGIELQDNDVLVLAQKIISKAENRYAYLNDVSVSERAASLARQTDKDPRIVQLILDQSTAVVRQRKGAIIVEHQLGYIHANAGIDQSNIASDDDNPRVLLLPQAPDASAQSIRQQLALKTGAQIKVIINDSAGRAWREGTMGFAIGTAGFVPVVNLVGAVDLFDRKLEATTVAVADELAAAASFLMGQAAESAPVVVIRGAQLRDSNQGSDSLIRSPANDLFR
jgi:coenzyme F420-0:L-glutamate ligase/coenzyme F420-1:gamma-L-glutamate ligase